MLAIFISGPPGLPWISSCQPIALLLSLIYASPSAAISLLFVFLWSSYYALVPVTIPRLFSSAVVPLRFFPLAVTLICPFYYFLGRVVFLCGVPV